MSLDGTHDQVMTDEQVAVLEERRRAALVRGDAAELGQLLADDCVYVHSSGMCESGASYVERCSAGGFAYEELRVEEQSVTVSGPWGIVVSKQHALMRIGTERHASSARCSATWLISGGRHRLVAFQSTPLVT